MKNHHSREHNVFRNRSRVVTLPTFFPTGFFGGLMRTYLERNYKFLCYFFNVSLMFPWYFHFQTRLPSHLSGCVRFESHYFGIWVSRDLLACTRTSWNVIEHDWSCITRIFYELLEYSGQVLEEYIKHFLLHVNRRTYRKRTILNKILRYFRDTYFPWNI